MPAYMKGMPRRFDAGKDAYAHEHRAHSGQDCRHIIANLTLIKYGADPRKYAAIAHQNYRMGGQHLNRSVENRLDNAFHHIVNNDGEEYDAYDLYKCGIPYQQQEQLLRNRFNAAEEFYDQTNDPAYRNIARDIKTVVTENLAARHTLTFPW